MQMRIGRMLRMEGNDDCMVAMEWQPEIGKRNVGRPKP